MGAWYVPLIILTLFSNAYGASFELASVIFMLWYLLFA